MADVIELDGVTLDRSRLQQHRLLEAMSEWGTDGPDRGLPDGDGRAVEHDGDEPGEERRDRFR
jgi:hypothetical protein